MPFQSKAQARYMFAKHPGMAKEWAEKTPSIKDLPEKVHKGKFVDWTEKAEPSMKPVQHQRPDTPKTDTAPKKVVGPSDIKYPNPAKQAAPGSIDRGAALKLYSNTVNSKLRLSEQEIKDMIKKAITEKVEKSKLQITEDDLLNKSEAPKKTYDINELVKSLHNKPLLEPISKSDVSKQSILDELWGKK